MIKLLLEIFDLVLAGGESNRLKAAELVRKLDTTARRDLRAVCREIDELIDDTVLAEMAQRRPWRL